MAFMLTFSLTPFLALPSTLYRVKSQVLASATEAAEMILRVDEIIKAAPRRRQ